MTAILTVSAGSPTWTRGTLARRLAAAVSAAMGRARARHEYRRLLQCDEIMRDIGVDRVEVRRALMECGGRL